MIFVDGEKYACVQCIRGHRSSTCRHSLRPLVQVRSRGRPALNQAHRIAVTASELVLTRDKVTFQSDVDAVDPPKKNKNNSVVKSCCSIKRTLDRKIESEKPEEANYRPSNSCCKAGNINFPIRSCCNHRSTKTMSNCPSCKSGNSSVILLRASKRQFVDVKNGNLDFVAPYSSSSFNTLNNGANSGLSITNSKDNKMKENPKKREHNEMNVSQLQVFKKVKVVQNSPTISSSGSHISLESSKTPTSEELDQILSQHGTSRSATPFEQVYDMALTAGCADECNCGPDCSCPGCLIHRSNEELKAYGLLDNSPSPSVITSNFNSTDGFLDSVISKISEKYHTYTDDKQTSDDKGEVNQNYNTSSNVSDMDNLINFKTIDELLNIDFFPHGNSDGCYCDDNECSCFNCERHSIMDGIKTLPNGDKINLNIDLYDNGNFQNGVNDLEMYSHNCECPEGECDC